MSTGIAAAYYGGVPQGGAGINRFFNGVDKVIGRTGRSAGLARNAAMGVMAGGGINQMARAVGGLARKIDRVDQNVKNARQGGNGINQMAKAVGGLARKLDRVDQNVKNARQGGNGINQMAKAIGGLAHKVEHVGDAFKKGRQAGGKRRRRK
jgi:outer membrane murein-binding lipoprotein Lpp